MSFDLTLDAGLPANIDAERTILGAILLDNAAHAEAAEKLAADDFSLDSHQRIFLRMSELVNTQRAVDIVTLANELARYKEIETVGGVAYLASLTEGLPLRPVIEDYIRIVKDKSLLRRLMAICSVAIARAVDQSETGIEIADSLIDKFQILASIKNSSLPFFSDFPTFATSQSAQMDWMLTNVIERGSNGFIAADPKSGKSFCAADLALSLASGSHWIDFGVPRPTRTAIVSREDNPALTAWRLRNLLNAKNLSPYQLGELETNLYVNTRAQTPSFMLDNDQEVRSLIAALRERRIEFCILDVLNVLHRADENDNSQMADVLRKAKRIQDETGAALGIIHHFNKSDASTRITRRLRGASAIAGFAEWVIGISVADEENGIRKMEFELKAGAAPDPVYFVMDGQEGSVRVKRITMQSRNERTARKQ